MEHRHPHLILGIDHGASAEQAAAAFGRKAKRARRDPDAPFSIEDLTWALNQLEHGEQDPADALTQLQVPADPDAYQDPNQPKAAQQQLRRLSPKNPATSRLLRDTHQRRQQLNAAAETDSQPAFFLAHQGAEHLPALPPPTAAHPLRRTVLVGSTAVVAAIAFAISTFFFQQNPEPPPQPVADTQPDEALASSEAAIPSDESEEQEVEEPVEEPEQTPIEDSQDTAEVEAVVAEPRCSVRFSVDGQPTFHCDTDEYMAFEGGLCEAFDYGTPSVRDYLESWNDEQETLMRISTDSTRRALGFRIRQLAYVAEGVDDLEVRLGELFEVATGDRNPAHNSFGFRRTVRSLLGAYLLNCTDAMDDPSVSGELLSVADLVHEWGADCSPESLGPYGERITRWSDWRITNGELFYSLTYRAIGVVIDIETHRQGAVYDILVLGGSAGNVNYYTSGSHASPGEMQTWTGFGTDNDVIGFPEVGDLVLWFDRSFDGRKYGWASTRTVLDESDLMADLAIVDCW